MSADGPIEIEFPSLTRSGQPTTPADIAPPPESNDSDDGDGDDFAWLAAAFADDDADVDLEGAALEDLELDEYEPGELPSEEDFAELWAPVQGDPDSMGAPSTSEEPVGRSLAGAERLPTAETEPQSPPVSATASDENESERPLLGSIPALKTAIAGRGSESPPLENAVEELRPDLSDAELEPRHHDAEGEAPVDAALALLDESVEDPDPTAEEPVDIAPEAAVPDQPEEAVEPDQPNLPIEAIKRRPGFREELLAAFGQIYKR